MVVTSTTENQDALINDNMEIVAMQFFVSTVLRIFTHTIVKGVVI